MSSPTDEIIKVIKRFLHIAHLGSVTSTHAESSLLKVNERILISNYVAISMSTVALYHATIILS